jgi:hypothetical protein
MTLKGTTRGTRKLADQLLEWLKSNSTELSEMSDRMDEAAPQCFHLLERLSG